ncbi:hypothetical protein, partial [Paraburkholderia silvatlantica]|uniref:hypothetical protein n=1 Tax=Paraburkholderia silvatlantica TaxID=321895 RepID=UPI001A9C65FB
LPIICQDPANASTTFGFKSLLHRALRIFQTRLRSHLWVFFICGGVNLSSAVEFLAQAVAKPVVTQYFRR